MTTFLAVYQETAWKRWDDFMKVVIIVIATSSIINTKTKIHGLVWVLVISIGVHTVYGGIAGALSGGASTMRGPAGSPFDTENPFARICIMGFPLMVYLATQSSQKWVRSANWFGAMATVSGLIATGSRGGFIGFGAMLGYAWLTTKHKVRNLIIFAIIASTAGAIMNSDRLSTWIDRMSTISEASEEKTAQQRFKSWEYGFGVAKASPIFGDGFGAYWGNRWRDDDGRIRKLEAHSNYFQMMAEHGFVGLFLYVLLGTFAFTMISKIKGMAKRGETEPWTGTLAQALSYSFIGYFVGGLTITHGFFELYYALLGLLSGLYSYCLHSTSTVSEFSAWHLRRRPGAPQPIRAVN